MPELIIYPIEHRQEKRIALKFDYVPNSIIDQITRTLPGRKFSATKKLWHIPYRDDYESLITEAYGSVENISIKFNGFPKPRNTEKPGPQKKDTSAPKVIIRIDKKNKKFYAVSYTHLTLPTNREV